MFRNQLVRGIFLITSLVLVGYLLHITQLQNLLTTTWVDQEIRFHGFRGELLFLGMAIMFTSIGLPRQVISFLSGYTFGLGTGLIIALFTTVMSCMMTFFFARFLGQEFINRRFSHRTKKINQYLNHYPIRTAMFIRFMPVGNNLLTNLAAGISTVSAVGFFLGSGIGYIPQTLIFALIGSGIEVNPVFRIGLGIILFTIAAFIGVYLYKQKLS